MKILVIDPSALALDFCLRSVSEGAQVRWFIRNKPEGQITVGDGLVQKVQHWEQHMNWADLVFLPDNSVYMADLEKWRQRGYPIYGANASTAQWELDRQAGMDVLAAHGVKLMEGETFTSYDKAIAYVKQTMGRYVSKPFGDADRSLSYVSKGPADMIWMLEKWKRTGKRVPGFIMQRFQPGIEMAVGAWVGPDGFASPWCENFEHKKLMPDDCGPNTGEMGCYSADTEVLTSSGWKFWPDVTMDDELATLNDGVLKFERPSAVVAYDVDTPMVAWKNRSIDLLVTPNHNMFVQSQFDARHEGGESTWKFEEARNCTQAQYAIRRTANWQGADPESFIIQGVKRPWGHGREQNIAVPFTDWAWFLGFYMAEGSCGPASVQLAQSNSAKAAKAEGRLNTLPFKVIRHENGFAIHNTELVAYLRQFGRSYEKWVPEHIKESSPASIRAFLDGYALGDAHTQPNGARYFYTSNPRLADDLQDLMLRAGFVGVIKKLKRKEKFGEINGRAIIQRRDAYVVYERQRKIRSWLDARDRTEPYYKGKVYCATVSSHVLYVRRNGKPVWCGNTVVYYTEKSKLADKVLKPLEQYLVRCGHIGFVDVAVIIDDKGNPWPLEFTMRPGWPIFNIQQQLHRSTASWMLESLNGSSIWTNFLTELAATGVVMAIPDFPYNRLSRKEVSGVPIYNLDKVSANIHPCELKAGMVPV